MSCPLPSSGTSRTDAFLVIKILLLRCELFIVSGYFEDAQSDLLWAKQLLFSDPLSSPRAAKTRESDAELQHSLRNLTLIADRGQSLPASNENGADPTANRTTNAQEEEKANDKVSKEYYRRRLLHLHFVVQDLQRPARDEQRPNVKKPDWTCLQQIGPMSNKCYEQKLEADRQRLSKLIQDKGREIRSIRLQRQSLIEPKLESYSDNEQLPGARRGLRMQANASKGRHVMADQTFEMGQILFVENAIVSWLRPSMYLHYCNSCLKRLKGHFVPCSHCPDVIYCGVKCRNHSWTLYHKFECARLYFLRYLAYGHMALRILIMYQSGELLAQRRGARERFERSNRDKLSVEDDLAPNEINNNESSGDLLDDKSKSIESTHESESKSIGFDSITSSASISESLKEKQRWVEQGLTCKEGDLSVFYSLVSSDRHFSCENLLALLFMSKVLGKLAIGMNLISENASKEEHLQICASLFDCVLKVNFNCYLVSDHKIVPSTESRLWAQASAARKIGIGVYGSASMVSHSCDFNSIKLALGSQLIIYNIKRLLPGDEVTVTYGPHYQKNSLYDRRKLLSDCYLFHCECEACSNGWENLSLAYKCTACDQGALIWYMQGGGHCTNCKRTYDKSSSELNDLFEQSDQAQDLMQRAQQALDNHDLRICRKNLRESLRVCKKVFFSFQRMYPLFSVYADYYEARRKYVKARKMVEKMSDIQASKFGAGTVEWLSTCIKKAVLMVREIQQKRGKSTKVKLLKKLEIQLKSCEKTYEELCKQEIVSASRFYFEQIPRLKSIRQFLESELDDL
jgi:hypothetical protein